MIFVLNNDGAEYKNCDNYIETLATENKSRKTSETGKDEW